MGEKLWESLGKSGCLDSAVESSEGWVEMVEPVGDVALRKGMRKMGGMVGR